MVISAPALRVPALCFILGGLLSACSYLPDVPSIDSIKPYRIDIQQGNFLSQEMVSKLKKGMTREQVRFVLGTPLVTDIFHANRWDYVFYREVRGGPPQRQQLTVFFENDRLDRVAGEVKPVDGKAPAGTAPEVDAAPKAAGGTDAKN